MLFCEGKMKIQRLKTSNFFFLHSSTSKQVAFCVASLVDPEESGFCAILEDSQTFAVTAVDRDFLIDLVALFVDFQSVSLSTRNDRLM